jgi:hypothetical protein
LWWSARCAGSRCGCNSCRGNCCTPRLLPLNGLGFRPGHYGRPAAKPPASRLPASTSFPPLEPLPRAGCCCFSTSLWPSRPYPFPPTRPSRPPTLPATTGGMWVFSFLQTGYSFREHISAPRSWAPMGAILFARPHPAVDAREITWRCALLLFPFFSWPSGPPTFF